MSELIIPENRHLSNRQEDALQSINRDFLYAVQRDFTPSTHRAYRENMKRFIGWYGMADQEADLKELLMEYKANLRSCYDSPNTINAHLTTVRGFAGFIYERGFTDTDLSRHLKNIRKADGHTRTALDKYQLSDLIEGLNSRRSKRNGERDRMLVLLAVSNGLRVNEIANINIQDITQREGDKVIYLLRKGYQDKGCYTILSPRIHREIMAFISDKVTGALFRSENGDNLTSDSVGRIIRLQYRKAGIIDKSITPHSLRHTYSKLCIEAGVDIIDLSVSLNHKSVDTTMIYLKSLNRHERSPEKKLHIDF